ncbi:putative cytochrome P450 superfamily [Helianthus anomalus]
MAMFTGFNIGSYIPWLSWVDLITGSIGRAEKVAKEFDELLEEVIEEHVNKKKKRMLDETMVNRAGLTHGLVKKG